MTRQLVLTYFDHQKRLIFRWASDNAVQFMQRTQQIQQTISSWKVNLGYHVLSTPTGTLASLQTTDPYFAKVKDFSDLAQFKQQVHALNLPTALEVAAFVLDQDSAITPLTLQKVLYYSYADYLSTTKLHLFKGSFKAWQHGPVEPEVWHWFKQHPSAEQIRVSKRAFYTHSSLETISTIQQKLAQYGPDFKQLTAQQLDQPANPTHRPGTPWSRAYQQGQNTEITDQAIRQFHQLEALKPTGPKSRSTNSD